MTAKSRQRGLSRKFMDDLQNGMLRPLLERVKADTTLDLEIREDYLNVYYRGGSLLRVERPSDKGYQIKFDTNYAPEAQRAMLALPTGLVTNEAAVTAWIEKVPLLKDTMDLWFGKHPKDERVLQQMVVWENNSSQWAGGTDYFVIDIEYDNRQGARFDIVALRWDSKATARKLAGGYLPRLTLIEVKAGDGALKGKSGLHEHLNHNATFLANEARVDEFRSEMLHLFKQKRALGLIKSLQANEHKVERFDHQIDEALLIIGHDPGSKKLDALLAEVRKSGAGVLMCHANHAGFGLYAENMRPA